MPKLAALLLSAGHSSRMGQPKALLEWQGKPLINNQLKTLKALDCTIGVVLGAHEEAISTVLKNEEVLRVSHARFDAGMGSSIAAGVSAIRHLNPEAVLIVGTLRLICVFLTKLQ
jgi:molybdenum cofactor cytidylyltransferase